MGRICAQMFQFWRFTNQMVRYKVGLTVADRSLTRNWLAFVGDGNAHTGHEVRLTLLVSLGRVTRVLLAEPRVSPIG